MRCDHNRNVKLQTVADHTFGALKSLLAHTVQSHEYKPFCVEIWVEQGVCKAVATTPSKDSHPGVRSHKGSCLSVARILKLCRVS